MGYQMPISIKKVVEGIQSNEYILPAIQREFVWDIEQIEKFFDSLMKEYPIGIFLFWKINPESLQRFQFYRFMDRFHERDFKHNEPIELVGQHDATAVLDGQQRLTALNIGLRGWYAHKMPYYHWNSDHAFPRKKLYLDLRKPSEDPEKDYEFKFLREVDLEKDQNNPSIYWFPVDKIIDFNEMQDAFEYCVDAGLTESGDKYPHKTLLRLWSVIHKDNAVHYFLEEEQNLDRVLNIFIRVNSGGTQLSYSDLLLSIAIAQWEELDAREEIYNLVDELNSVGEGFNFSKDFVLKSSLVLSDTTQIAFKVDNFNRENMNRIEKSWEGISRALRLTANLVSSWGYSRQTLVSANALIPIAYFIFKRGNPVNIVESKQWEDERKKIRRWLITALLKRAFSGQSDSVLRTNRGVLQDSMDGFPEEELYSKLAASSKNMSFSEAELDGLISYQYDQRYTFSVLALLYPWLKYDQHFHVDHIYPRSMFTQSNLESLGVPRDRWFEWLDHVNDLANLQLLQGLQNEEKSDQDFEQWLMDRCEGELEIDFYREQHMIPEIDLRFENFPEFRVKREEMIKQKLRGTVNVLKTMD